MAGISRLLRASLRGSLITLLVSTTLLLQGCASIAGMTMVGAMTGITAAATVAGSVGRDPDAPSLQMTPLVFDEGEFYAHVNRARDADQASLIARAGAGRTCLPRGEAPEVISSWGFENTYLTDPFRAGTFGHHLHFRCVAASPRALEEERLLVASLDTQAGTSGVWGYPPQTPAAGNTGNVETPSATADGEPATPRAPDDSMVEVVAHLFGRDQFSVRVYRARSPEEAQKLAQEAAERTCRARGAVPEITVSDGYLSTMFQSNTYWKIDTFDHSMEIRCVNKSPEVAG